MSSTSALLPPQKTQACPHCRAVNWLPIPPDAPVSACVRFNCWKCGSTFKHFVGTGLTLFLVRCACALAALIPMLAVLWFLAVLYCGWCLVHRFGFAAAAVLLVACGVCLSLRHEGIKSLPAALWLFVGGVTLSRFSLYLLHRPENATAAAALMTLILGGCAWFGAPPEPYDPEAVYDGLMLHGAAGLDGIDNLEALEDADF